MNTSLTLCSMFLVILFQDSHASLEQQLQLLEKEWNGLPVDAFCKTLGLRDSVRQLLEGCRTPDTEQARGQCEAKGATLQRSVQTCHEEHRLYTKCVSEVDTTMATAEGLAQCVGVIEKEFQALGEGYHPCRKLIGAEEKAFLLESCKAPKDEDTTNQCKAAVRGTLPVINLCLQTGNIDLDADLPKLQPLVDRFSAAIGKWEAKGYTACLVVPRSQHQDVVNYLRDCRNPPTEREYACKLYFMLQTFELEEAIRGVDHDCDAFEKHNKSRETVTVTSILKELDVVREKMSNALASGNACAARARDILRMADRVVQEATGVTEDQKDKYKDRAVEALWGLSEMCDSDDLEDDAEERRRRRSRATRSGSGLEVKS